MDHRADEPYCYAHSDGADSLCVLTLRDKVEVRVFMTYILFYVTELKFHESSAVLLTASAAGFRGPCFPARCPGSPRASNRGAQQKGYSLLRRSIVILLLRPSLLMVISKIERDS